MVFREHLQNVCGSRLQVQLVKQTGRQLILSNMTYFVALLVNKEIIYLLFF